MLFLLLVLVAVVRGIIGAAAEGLGYLLAIGGLRRCTAVPAQPASPPDKDKAAAAFARWDAFLVRRRDAEVPLVSLELAVASAARLVSRAGMLIRRVPLDGDREGERFTGAPCLCRTNNMAVRLPCLPGPCGLRRPCPRHLRRGADGGRVGAPAQAPRAVRGRADRGGAARPRAAGVPVHGPGRCTGSRSTHLRRPETDGQGQYSLAAPTALLDADAACVSPRGRASPRTSSRCPGRKLLPDRDVMSIRTSRRDRGRTVRSSASSLVRRAAPSPRQWGPQQPSRCRGATRTRPSGSLSRRVWTSMHQMPG
ncbi:hypothetical protein M2283_009771 [Streptomyces pseudovenezuelae]|uniref:Uncharacterized protein n=1 Tax=Streptomyces pseudovenezuelae TaxID=67350 RepID=A0ABT6M1J7_9ACTN|nr:hypothetical protein [Streptomyces pseudovenezuelae]